MKNFTIILTILIALSITTNAQWTQIGNDIDGEATGDLSGWSVSLSSDGSIVAVGAIGNSENGYYAGHVRIYEYNSGYWSQMGNDIDSEAAEDRFGSSVSLSSDGTIVAIGASTNDGSIGHVRVYEYSGGNWVQKGNDIDGEAGGDHSGGSVSLSSDGSILAIGASGNDGSGIDAGHVRVYEYSVSNWVQIGSDIDGEATEDYSGRSVSLSADGLVLAVGAYGSDGNGENAGQVRIYEYSGGNWVQIGSDIDGEAAEDYSGISVSLSSDGSILAIGANGNDGNDTINSKRGHVRIYEYSSGIWIQLGSDIDGKTEDDRSGWSVSLSSDGSIVAIGAPAFYDTTSVNYVRVYEYIAGNWAQIGSDIYGEAVMDYSGWAVSLSSSGTVLAIGAYLNNGNGTEAGHVRVYYNCSINTIDTSVTQNGDTLTANAVGAIYQWVVCDSSFAPISGETNQSFTPTSNGLYAVLISVNGCIDTSSCYNVTSIEKIDNNTEVSIYPNPTTGVIRINNEKLIINNVEVFDIYGKELLKSKIRSTKHEVDLSQQPKGIYIIKVTTNKGVAVEKVVLE